MALLNIFKKKKEAKQKIEKSEGKTQPPKTKEEVQIEERKTPEPERAIPRKATGIAYRVLRRPHVSEKASMLAEQNQYTFEVWPDANKFEVKKAVEDVYHIDVLSVRIINIPSKRRRRGRIEGFKKGYKKAIVKIKEGQKIEVLPR